MANIAETFTGTSGTLPSGWTKTGSGTAMIQSNAFRIVSATNPYTTTRASRSGLANGDLLVDILVSTVAEHYPEVLVRQTSATAYAAGYGVTLLPDVGLIALREYVGGSYTDLQQASFAFTASQTYRLRFQFNGSTLQAKIWNTTGSEPSSWMVSVTDSTVTAAGTIHLASTAGAATATRTVTYDTLTVTDLDLVPSGPEPSRWHMSAAA